MTRTTRRTFARATDGAVATELALLLPLLVLLFAGVFEVGRMVWDHHTATKAVRDAVRYLTRVDLASDCSAAGTRDLASVVETGRWSVARNLVLRGKPQATDADPYLVIGWSGLSDPDSIVSGTLSCITNDLAGLYTGESFRREIELTAAWTYAPTFGGLVPLPTVTMTINHRQFHAGS